MRSSLSFLGMLLMAVAVAPETLRAQRPEPARDLTERPLEDLLAIEVVSAASRYEQRISEAPADVTIVTADEIARHGYRTLGELLQNVRGLFVSDDRTYQYLGVRGFDRPGDFNNRLLVLVDGHRLNDNIYGAVTLNTSFTIDLAIVDRVEIVRGPGSSLYGTNALFAVINVVTKRVVSHDGLRVGADFSDFETGRADVSYGKSFRPGRGLLVAFNVGQIGGPRFDEDDFSRFYAKAIYRNLSVHASYLSRQRLLPLPSFGPFADPRRRTLDSRGFVDLEYERRYGPRSALTMKVSFDESESSGQYAYVRRDGTDAPWAVMDRGHGRWLSADVQRTRTFAGRHRVTAGSELRWDITRDVGQFGPAGSHDRRSSFFGALFAQDEYRPARAAAIQAGLRYDHYGTFGGTTNPRVALILRPFGGTSLKLLYGRAFRAPTAYELYRDRDRPSVTGLDLQPERIRTYEASWDQTLGPWFHATVSSYDYEMRDVISLGLIGGRVPVLVYRNRDEAHGRGIEAELRGQSPGGVKGSVSYAHQRAQNEQHQELTNSPRHLATARFTLPLAGHRLFLAGDSRFGSSRLMLTGDRTRSAFVTDLTLTGVVKPRRLDLALSVYNLFNGGVVDPFPSIVAASMPQAGRTWRLGFRTAF